jgi:glycosyltransferase involved in cell wall biosynthesis
VRILLWYWGRRGGGAQFSSSLAQGLSRQPGLALALSVSRQGDLVEDFAGLGLPCDVVDTYGGAVGFVAGLTRLSALRRRLVRQARDFGADIVLSGMTHLYTPLVAPGLARAGLRFVPVLHDALPHPGDPALLWNWRLDRELDAASAAVVLSDAVAASIAARRPALPLLRLPLGAHLPGHAPPAGVAVRGAEFLFFGRIRPYKGLDLLRDAFAELRRRQPAARLRVVGAGDIEAVAPGLSALPGVTVESRWVPEAEMPALIAAAHAVVLPYREASQSGVLPLALACGVPVVATPVGGLTDQLPRGAGQMAAAATPAALAAAMEALLDPAARARRSVVARAAGAALLDWDAQAARLVEGLQTVARPQARP